MPTITRLTAMLLPLSLGLFAPAMLQAQALGDPACDQLLLVSDYRGNNVKIYDACDYSYLRDLDSDGILAGPQAIALDPNGDLVVVSETNGRLVRYHRDSLSYDRVIAGDRPETPELEPTPVRNPTGLVITPGGRMFAGSYSDQVVTEVDPATGEAIRNIVTQADSGIRGPDTGMWLEGNRLIVPGFDSSTLVEANIDEVGSSRELVAPGAGGLNAPRTVLRQANGNLLVTSWRGNQVLEYDGETGAFLRVVIDVFGRPTGMAFESENVLLLASDLSSDITRVQIDTGEVLGKIIGVSDGGLRTPTFIMVLDKRVDRLVENRAFWVVGVGDIVGTSIVIEELNYTRQGVFGADFDPNEISLQPWGSITLDLAACDAGSLAWQALDPVFGDGAYDIMRVAADPDGQRCLNEGYDNVAGSDWMTGVWFGGAARAGEGLFVNVLEDGRAVVAWYTYLP